MPWKTNKSKICVEKLIDIQEKFSVCVADFGELKSG